MGKPARKRLAIGTAADEGPTAPMQKNGKKLCRSRKQRTILVDVSNDAKRRKPRDSSTKMRDSTEDTRPRRRSARLTRQGACEGSLLVGNESVAASKCGQASTQSETDDDASKQSEETRGVSKKKQSKRPISEVSSSPTEVDKSLDLRPSKRRHARISCITSGAANQEHNHNLVCSPLDEAKYTLGIAKHDAVCRKNVLWVPDYATDIFHRLYNAEAKSSPTPYMDQQDEIDESMRMMLIDWLVEVHMKFRLEEETLFLCVNIIDRYLAVTNVARSSLQLVGVTALLLACKYEEIYPPLVKDCVYITDKAYSRQNVLDMECEILGSLNFNVSAPTAYPFLQRFLFMLHAKRTMGYAAHYYMDRVLLEHDMLKFRPSVIAAAAVCLAVNHPCIRYTDNVKHAAPGIPQNLLSYTGFSKKIIEEAAAWISKMVSNPVQEVARRRLSAVKDKYNISRYKYISRYEPPDVADLWANDE